MIKYVVSIKNKDGGTRIIFFGKKTGIFLDKDSFNIKVKYIPRDSDLIKIMSDKKFDERFLDVATISEFLKGCSKPKVQMINAENRTLFGSIQQPNICCYSNPDFQLIDNLV